MRAEKSRGRNLQRLLPAAAVLLVILAVHLFLERGPDHVVEIRPVDGMLDITGVDLSHEVANVDNSWDFYPNALYTSADFAAGVGRPVPEADDPDAGSEPRYGTYRLIIKARPEQYYAICSYSIDYSTRVFVNGTEVASFGTVADNAAAHVPQVGSMTIPLYSGASGEIEVIYQFSNFVHRDGGFIQPTYLSTPQNIEAFKADNDLASLSLSGGLLVLFLYFLLCAALQRRGTFLLLAVCCLMMALRDQNFLVVHALPPGTSWYLTYRIFMTVTALLPGMVLLLLGSLYPGTVKKRLTILHAAAMGIAAALTAVLPTFWLVTVCTAAWICAIPYLFCLTWGVTRHYLRRKSFQLVDALAAGGAAMLILSILMEAVYVNNSSAVSHHGIMPRGMLIFDLLIAASISLRAREQEAALSESRSRSELLERMNAMNLDFLHQVAHELKTPLTVISGYAQLTGLQMSTGHISSETPENLKVIRSEALRLADMVTKLLEYSYGKTSEAQSATVEVGPLLESVRAICTPMCLKNSNRLDLSGGTCADVCGSWELLLQVFINLVINANRHTQDGVITISASDRERREHVVFRVEDTGSGIDSAQLPHIFERGYSGDGGSGLGLSICREAVEAHGGILEVERTGPDGTVFMFTVRKKEAAP